MMLTRPTASADRKRLDRLAATKRAYRARLLAGVCPEFPPSTPPQSAAVIVVEVVASR